MAIPYLKIEAEKAIQILDNCIVSGYQIKDKITQEYYAEKAKADEKITEWQKMANDWTDNTIHELSRVFISQKELYNFRDAHILPLRISNTNIKWNNIINHLQARIDKLNEYDSYIRNQFNVKVEVVGRDKIIQTGDGKVKIQN